MRQPPSVSSRGRDPAGSVERAGRSTCPAGKVGDAQAVYVHSLQHKVVLVDLHSSCRAAFNATGLLWAEAPS